MVRLAPLPSVALVLLSGCLAHERPEEVDAAGLVADAGTGATDAWSSPDAAVEVDAAPPAQDAGLCMPTMPTNLRFEPALPEPATGIRIVWLGYEYDAAEDGARIHLDTCGGSPPCPLDLVVPHVGDALSAIGGATGIGGTLDTDGSTYAVVHLLDARRCATCGGQLELLAGRLTSGLDAAIEVHDDAGLCTTGCGQLRAIAATAGATTVVARMGAPVVGPLLVAVASDYHVPCWLCDCAAADVPATGVIAWGTGIFVPRP